MAVHCRELTLPNIVSLLSSDAFPFQVGVLQLSFDERFFLLILAYAYGLFLLLIVAVFILLEYVAEVVDGATFVVFLAEQSWHFIYAVAV